jgi:hypothetical protein
VSCLAVPLALEIQHKAHLEGTMFFLVWCTPLGYTVTNYHSFRTCLYRMLDGFARSYVPRDSARRSVVAIGHPRRC